MGGGSDSDTTPGDGPRLESARWHALRPPNPLLETRFVLPRRGAVADKLRRWRMTKAERTARTAAAPDRAVLTEEIFPEVARRGGDMLFVGVRAYTEGYPALLERHGGRCWTMDIAAAAAPFGAHGRHVTGSVTEVATLFPDLRFTTIVLTGVLGFGVDRFSDQVRTLAQCARALAPDGVLVLGWNDRRIHPSLFEEAASRWYDYRPFGHLPSRLWVRGIDHNFAFLRRR